MRIAYETISKDSLQSCFGIEICSYLNLTLEEVEEKTKVDKSGERSVNLYKQKCKSSQISQLKKENKTLVDLYKLEYEVEMKSKQGSEVDD